MYQIDFSPVTNNIKQMLNQAELNKKRAKKYFRFNKITVKKEEIKYYGFY